MTGLILLLVTAGALINFCILEKLRNNPLAKIANLLIASSCCLIIAGIMLLIDIFIL